jgi:hypothetical protein
MAGFIVAPTAPRGAVVVCKAREPGHLRRIERAADGVLSATAA